jgi:hypothetical protein
MNDVLQSHESYPIAVVHTKAGLGPTLLIGIADCAALTRLRGKQKHEECHFGVRIGGELSGIVDSSLRHVVSRQTRRVGERFWNSHRGF